MFYGLNHSFFFHEIIDFDEKSLIEASSTTYFEGVVKIKGHL